ncbi:MAG: hypothetical protein Q9195_002505 [Heterodermia aff. obscurata]
MANRGTRYDPLRLIEEEAELGNFDTEAPQPITHIDNDNVPMQRRRRLQKMLMASVALNATGCGEGLRSQSGRQSLLPILHYFLED